MSNKKIMLLAIMPIMVYFFISILMIVYYGGNTSDFLRFSVVPVWPLIIFSVGLLGYIKVFTSVSQKLYGLYVYKLKAALFSSAVAWGGLYISTYIHPLYISAAAVYLGYAAFVIAKYKEAKQISKLTIFYQKNSHKFVNTAPSTDKATSTPWCPSDTGAIATAAAVVVPAAAAIGIEEFIRHYTDGQYGSVFGEYAHSEPGSAGIDESVGPSFNPANGLPMIDGIMDVQGNVFGTNSAETFTGIDHHSNFGGDISSPMFDDHNSGISHSSDDHTSFDHGSFDHHSSFDDSNRY